MNEGLEGVVLRNMVGDNVIIDYNYVTNKSSDREGRRSRNTDGIMSRFLDFR